MLQGEKCFEISRYLKQQEQTANIQILMLAETNIFENMLQEFDLLADDFLIKPLNIYELRTRANALLKKKTFLDRLYSGPADSVDAAITDSISGLANQSYFRFFLNHEMKRCVRIGRTVALLMMELNTSRQNTSWAGHPAGEQWLKDFGIIIKENIREVDLGTRYTQGQFAIVLINTDGTGAMIVAERIRNKIQTQFLTNSENNSAKIATLNTGVAVYPSDADSIEPLINQAEKRLSEFKKKS